MSTNLSTRSAVLVLAAMLGASAYGAVASSAPAEERRPSLLATAQGVLDSFWSWILGDAGSLPDPNLADGTAVLTTDPPTPNDGWGMDPNGVH